MLDVPVCANAPVRDDQNQNCRGKDQIGYSHDSLLSKAAGDQANDVLVVMKPGSFRMFTRTQTSLGGSNFSAKVYSYAFWGQAIFAEEKEKEAKSRDSSLSDD